ncbi:MAG: helix-turn-helix domain-containing protein [Gammaproteobacteria bacterium]
MSAIEHAQVTIIREPQQAAALMDPIRIRILELLKEPGTAAGVSRRLGMARQRAAYHVKTLEKTGLLHHVGDRKRGNCMERVVRTIAGHFLIDPEILGELGVTPAAVKDRFSSTYLVAVASHTAREVSQAQIMAAQADKKLGTLTLQSDIRFRSSQERAAFTDELTQAVTSLVHKYHDDESEVGRLHRLVLLGYPVVLETPESDKTSKEVQLTN